MIDQILEHNRKVVEKKACEQYATDKYPKKRTAILSCMDTRLLELLPEALGYKNGDIKMIKNAGGVIRSPFDSTMLSLLVGIYELGVENVMVIGHTNCGVQGMKADEMIHLMLKRGIPAERIEMVKKCGIDLDRWLTGFEDTNEAILDTVDLIRNHPLMPADVRVQGYVIDSVTGELFPLSR